MRNCRYYTRGKNGTNAAMLDTGIAVSSISCVQFITGKRLPEYYGIDDESVPVANPIDLRVVLDKVLLACRGKNTYRMVTGHTKNPG
jgi:hypothetical protein